MNMSIRSKLFLTLLCCSVTLLCLPCALGHGYLAQPAARNVYAYRQGTFYDPMSGNGVGTNANVGGPSA